MGVLRPLRKVKNSCQAIFRSGDHLFFSWNSDLAGHPVFYLATPVGVGWHGGPWMWPKGRCRRVRGFLWQGDLVPWVSSPEPPPQNRMLVVWRRGGSLILKELGGPSSWKSLLNYGIWIPSCLPFPAMMLNKRGIVAGAELGSCWSCSALSLWLPMRLTHASLFSLSKEWGKMKKKKKRQDFMKCFQRGSLELKSLDRLSYHSTIPNVSHLYSEEPAYWWLLN